VANSGISVLSAIFKTLSHYHTRVWYPLCQCSDRCHGNHQRWWSSWRWHEWNWNIYIYKYKHALRFTNTFITIFRQSNGRINS